MALTDAAVVRAQALQAMGLRTYDALHLACAEAAAVDVFLTTDDRMLRGPYEAGCSEKGGRVMAPRKV